LIFLVLSVLVLVTGFFPKASAQMPA